MFVVDCAHYFCLVLVYTLLPWGLCVCVAITIILCLGVIRGFPWSDKGLGGIRIYDWRDKVIDDPDDVDSKMM